MAILPGLRARRKAAKLTLEALGEAVGCTGAAVGSWERGEALPSADKLPGIARALGCSIDDLFRPADKIPAGRGPEHFPQREN